MPYMSPEQMNDGNTSNTIEPGTSANVVLTEYAPFISKKGKTIPKHVCKDADTGAVYELVGYAIHDALRPLNDQIEPGITVLKVEALDNGTAYCDYAVSIVAAGIKTDSQAF